MTVIDEPWIDVRMWRMDYKLRPEGAESRVVFGLDGRIMPSGTKTRAIGARPMIGTS